MGRNPWFSAGLIAGALAGAAGMLLYAPASGRETLAALKEHLRNAREEARAAGVRAEQDILTRYKTIRNASLQQFPGPESLAPTVATAR